jgi:hypothetical protein
MPLQAESFSAWIVENRIIPVREGDAYGLGDDAPHVRQRCRQVLSLLATYRGYEWHLLGTTQAQIADSTACSLTSSGTFTTLHMFTGSDRQNVTGWLRERTEISTAVANPVA